MTLALASLVAALGAALLGLLRLLLNATRDHARATDQLDAAKAQDRAAVDRIRSDQAVRAAGADDARAWLREHNRPDGSA